MRTIDMLTPKDRETIEKLLRQEGALVVFQGPLKSGKTELAESLRESMGRSFRILEGDSDLKDVGATKIFPDRRPTLLITNGTVRDTDRSVLATLFTHRDAPPVLVLSND